MTAYQRCVLSAVSFLIAVPFSIAANDKPDQPTPPKYEAFVPDTGSRGVIDDPSRYVNVLADKQPGAASLEEKYFETRDNFIRQFSTPSSPEADSYEKVHSKLEKALSKLEKQLQLIIGPVDLAHFPKRGKINLETLRQDAGF